MKICRVDAGPVGACRQVRGGAALGEVDEPLRRRHEPSASRGERCVLECLLESDTGENALGPVGRQVVWRHLDHDARVREAEPTARRRPPVDDDLVIARGRRADHAARAHAKGEHPAPVDLVGKRI